MGGCKKEGVASRHVHGRVQDRAAARRGGRYYVLEKVETIKLTSVWSICSTGVWMGWERLRWQSKGEATCSREYLDWENR